MTLKKKVLVGTLATSLAVTAFAGLPLSSKGLAEKLGVGVASAASTTPSLDKLADRAEAVWKAVEDKAGVKAKIDAFNDFYTNGITKQEKLDAIKPLTDKLEGAIELDENQKIALLDLVYATWGDFEFPIVTSKYVELLKNEDVAYIIKQIEKTAKVDVTVEATAKFAVNVLNRVNSKLSNTLIKDIVKNQDALKKVVEEAVDAEFDRTSSTEAQALYSALVPAYFANKQELKDTLKLVYNNVNGHLPDDLKAAKVEVASKLAIAYWAANKPIGGGGGGVGGGSVSTGTVSDFISSLSALKEKLATATAEEKQQLIAQALKDASAALAKAAALDVSALISVDGDKATVTIPESAISSYVQSIKDVKQALVDAIGTSEGLVIADASFNLGTVTQSNVAVNAAEAVLKQLADVGVGHVAFVVNGLTATLPVGGEFAKGIEFNVSKSAATAEQTKGLKAASDVYNFSLKLGGVDVEKFAQPVVIQFPVNAEGLDSELLSVARIESNGSLSFQGGDVNGSVIVEPRYSFSSYVVVENKVSFNDIASVQSWAGRQIEVIAAKGAIQGKAAGVFAPKDNITRGEFAKILVTALNLDNADATSDKFSDVKSTDWFAPYVAVAAEKGIINGRSATTFDPTATITRAELSTMIARALKTVKGIEDVKDVDVALAGFSDAGKIISSLKAGAALAASKNIVIGDGGKFRPNDNATRAEAAVIIYRAINVK
ncbi:S-layer homology domain-containing protein [Cohnella xylanilytica]|uniref:S-layer homology domain-containing protein n=1 Tax=Cohnella xylanilytica TaxID=557555 RepID=A0A841TYB2_9BACL|nr:S-layer homology domain-containing protein [Cohnella xylanilytica]MBB6693256.1 S-layer homology domain-containing protein [Cohnella xylanilytica]